MVIIVSFLIVILGIFVAFNHMSTNMFGNILSAFTIIFIGFESAMALIYRYREKYGVQLSIALAVLLVLASIIIAIFVYTWAELEAVSLWDLKTMYVLSVIFLTAFINIPIIYLISISYCGRDRQLFIHYHFLRYLLLPYIFSNYDVVYGVIAVFYRIYDL